MSLRDEILAMDDGMEEKVIVDQWGGKEILVKSLTAAQRYVLVERCMDKSGTKIDGKKLYIQTVIECAHDPADGKLLFTQKDYPALSDKNSGAIEAVVQVANRLNGIGVVEIGEMEKN